MTQWTHDDLPDADDVSEEYHLWVSQVITVLDAVVSHLNAHYPKPAQGNPDTDVMRSASRSERTAERHWPADQLATAADTIDSLRAHLDRMERERDAAVERAEAAERELADEYSEVNQKAAAWDRVASHPALRVLPDGRDGSYAGMVFERITWLFEAAEDARESNPVSAVSRADIEKAIYGSRRAGRECDEQGFVPVHVQEAVGQLCDLFGVEAEQAVAPVEAEVAMAWAEYRKDYQPNPDDLTAAHKAFTSGYLAAHVLGQEADHA